MKRRSRRRNTPQAAEGHGLRYDKGWKAFEQGKTIDEHGYKIPQKDVQLGGPYNSALSKIDDWQQGWLDAQATAKAACTVQAGSDDALLGGTLAEQERNADLPEGER